MNRWICRAAVIACVCCAQAASPPQCSAGPLLDWLSGRTPYYQPQPWHIDRRYPRTLPQNSQTIYAVQPAATYPAGVIYQQPAATDPTAAYQAAPLTQPTAVFEQTPTVQQPAVIPQVTSVPGAVPNAGCCGGCWLTRRWCSPRTTYRSTWVRVPVTRYRPVLGTAETAYGIPATQPCNGYTWSLRRVPVTTYRPLAGLWDQLFGPPQPASYFGTEIAAPCATYGTAVPQTVPQGSPYYPAQPGTTMIVPSTGLGTGPMNSGPGNTVPFNPAPASGAPGTGNTPADRAPSLNPNTIPPTNNTRSMMPPVPFGATPPATAPRASAGLNPDVLAGDGQPGSPGLTTTPPAAQPRRDNFFNVHPIRDPEADSRQRAIESTPRLLAPSNHSAANAPHDPVRAWQVVPIKWESIQDHDASAGNAAPSLTVSPGVAPQPPRRRFDDSGWQSAR